MNAVSTLPIVLILVVIITSKAGAQEPGPLTDSRKAYQKAVSSAYAPLKVKYMTRLNQLLQQYTKAGDLDAAMAVKKEIQASWLDGEWLLTGEKTGKTEEYWFHAKGRCASGTWSIDEGVVTTSSNAAGWSLRIELPKDQNGKVYAVSYRDGKAVEKLVMRRAPQN